MKPRWSGCVLLPMRCNAVFERVMPSRGFVKHFLLYHFSIGMCLSSRIFALSFTASPHIPGALGLRMQQVFVGEMCAELLCYHKMMEDVGCHVSLSLSFSLLVLVCVCGVCVCALVGELAFVRQVSNFFILFVSLPYFP